MKTNWKRIAMFVALIALVGVLVPGTVAFAQDTDDETSWPFFNLRQKMHEAIAGVLGIGVDEYDDAAETAQGQLLEEAVAEGVLTQEQADQLLARMEGDFGFRAMPFGRGWMGGWMYGPWMGVPENCLVSVAAEQLDLEVDDLLAELQDGKSIADVAEEQDVDLQTIAEAYIDTLSETLAEAVAEERITQEQAEQMLGFMSERVTAQLDSTCGGFWPGGFWPGGFQEQMPGGFWPGSFQEQMPGGFWPGGFWPGSFQEQMPGSFGRGGRRGRGFGGRGWMAPDSSGESTTSTATQL